MANGYTVMVSIPATNRLVGPEGPAPDQTRHSTCPTIHQKVNTLCRATNVDVRNAIDVRCAIDAQSELRN